MRVRRYLLYRDGRRIARLWGSSLDYTATGLRPWRSYRFGIVAVDPAGNRGPMRTVVD